MRAGRTGGFSSAPLRDTVSDQPAERRNMTLRPGGASNERRAAAMAGAVRPRWVRASGLTR